MAILFNRNVEITPVDPPETAALRLEAQLDKHFPLPDAEPKVSIFESAKWTLRDSSESRTSADTVREAFEEFREHDLEPRNLFHDRRLTATEKESNGVKISVHYPIYQKKILVAIQGTDRIAVDGVAASCERIKRAMEQKIDANAEQLLRSAAHNAAASHAGFSVEWKSEPTTPLQPLPSSWLARTWKDHMATFIITTVAGVVVIAIGLWLGLSPKS